jgi:hypothetical protein
VSLAFLVGVVGAFDVDLAFLRAFCAGCAAVAIGDTAACVGVGGAIGVGVGVGATGEAFGTEASGAGTEAVSLAAGLGAAGFGAKGFGAKAGVCGWQWEMV